MRVKYFLEICHAIKNKKTANLKNANLREATLMGANLMGADLRYADLRNATLMGANLKNADLRYADLRNATLMGANLSYANLREATLMGANLRNADLRDATLSCADLREATLSYANLMGANLSGVIGLLSPIEWMETHLEKTLEGYICYKQFGLYNTPPSYWDIQEGSIITETVDRVPTVECGCGVNVACKTWDELRYPMWKCLIRWEWMSGVVIPYNTDGKFRCEKVELLKQLEGEK